MTVRILLFFYSLVFIYINAQSNKKSDHHTDIEEVVISGNTFEQKAKDVPIPIKIINKKQILRSGSLRLDDILMEQTGVSIIHNHGTTLQLQGMSGDYTLILLNGEPMIGRTSGTLDLSSISINNIKRIEITKGPSSALYGSDALAGVVNIITDGATKNSGNLALRYGSNVTSYLNGDFDFVQEKVSINLSADRYSTEGYDQNSNSIDGFGRTQNPLENYTFSTKIIYKPDKIWKFSLYSRYYYSDSDEKILDPSNKKLEGYQKINDYSIQPRIDWNYNEKLNSGIRLYISSHKNNAEHKDISTNITESEMYFNQIYSKIENFTKLKWSETLKTTLGVGFAHDEMKANRYKNRKKSTQFYTVGQISYKPFSKGNILMGFRYDSNSIYGNQFNPKIATEIDITDNFSLQASVGRGFKAPEFRHLYLIHNNLLIGYSVYGTQELLKEIQNAQISGGVISGLHIDPSEIKAELNPETSWAYNFGVNFKPINNSSLKLNLFRNDVKNLINTIAVATKTNGQFIYSYKNLEEIYTQGLECDLSVKILQHFTLSGGYQYLEAKDKDVMNNIKNGRVYGKNNEGKEVRIKRKDYFGLEGRSKHSFNTKLFYENNNNGMFFNITGIYRGKYGFADIDGNKIITSNNNREFAPSYFLVNTSIGKKFLDSYTVGFGVNNLSNYTNNLTPEFAGRLFWISLRITY